LSNNLPQSLDAERALLGSVILNPTELKRSETEVLTCDDFSLEAHRKIYRVLLELWQNDVPIEPISICEALERKHELDACGGFAYISSLIDGIIDRPNVASYVNIVREKAMMRHIIALSQNAIARASNGGKSGEIIEAMLRAGMRLSTQVDTSEEMFVPWSKFRLHGSESVDWLVDGVIEKGTNGFLLGLPKARKSLAAAALAVSLVTGTPWLGFPVRRRRVAIVSREDFAGTTSRRLKQLFRGVDVDPESAWIDDVFWLNSRAEAKHLMLTDMRCLKTVIANLKKHRTEFLFLDVLKVLHESDENDAKEMGAVLKRVEQIRDDVGCQICIVHHSRKAWDDAMTLSEITRGSSVIAGFAEFLIGMRLVDDELKVMQAKFETKADQSQRPLYWKVEHYDPTRSIRLVRTEWEPPKKQSKRAYTSKGA